MPLVLYNNHSTTSYPSYYPGGAHCRLINDALDCLNFESINFTSFEDCRDEILAYPTNYNDQLYHAQDDYDSEYTLKWGHYWNPYTRSGLYGNLGAPYHANRYFNMAVNYYLGLGSYSVDKQLAYYNLGYAIHLVQDLTVPYHAQNDPFGKHADFETFCDHQHLYGNIDLPLNGLYTPQKDWKGDICPGGWVHQAALKAAPYHKIIEQNEYDYDLWLGIANYLMGEAIKLTAGFIFYFWQYVHNLDFDEDGVPAMVEQAYNTDYTCNDTDSDLISDFEEINLGLDGFCTDPTSNDTDKDDYTDFEEINIYFTDPTNEFDSPFYFVPLFCTNFLGLIDNDKIVFSWSQPANFLPGWHYELFRLEGNSEIVIYSNTKTFFSYIPPDNTTFYSYRVYCYKNSTLRGVYVQWGGSLVSWSSLERIKI